MGGDARDRDGGGEVQPAVKATGRRRARVRALLSHLATAGFAVVFAVAASWYIQPRMVKAREDAARWDTLIWLAKMPAERRDQIFREAVTLDARAREAAGGAGRQQQQKGASQ